MFTDVSVGMVAGESLSDSFEVTIPMLVNKKHVGIGKELLLMVEDRKAPKKRVEVTWQGHVKEEAQNREQAQKKAKVMTKVPATMEI